MMLCEMTDVVLPKSKSVKIDPAQTLYDYKERTWGLRGQDGSVFILLKSSYHAIDS